MTADQFILIALAVALGIVLGWFVIWFCAQLAPDVFFFPVKFVVKG